MMTYQEYMRKMSNLEAEMVDSRIKGSKAVEKIVTRDEQRRDNLKAELERMKLDTRTQLREIQISMVQEVRETRARYQAERKIIFNKITDLKADWLKCKVQMAEAEKQALKDVEEGVEDESTC